MVFGRGAAAVVKVKIVGDAASLAAAADKSEKEVKGLSGTLKGLGGALVAGGAVTAVVALGDAVLNEADRAENAIDRLELTVGGLTSELEASADQMHDLGLSRQDVLELEAAFAGTATALGLTNGEIVDLADNAAAAAGAVATLQGIDAAEAIELIGEAADGSVEDMKRLGIQVDENEVLMRAMRDAGVTNAEAISDQELKAARYKIVLEELAPFIEQVRDRTNDLEDSGRKWGAQLETLAGEVGELVDGPMSDLLGTSLDLIEPLTEISDWMDASPKFTKKMGDAFDNLTAGPLGSMLGTVNDILDAIGLVNKTPLVVQYKSTPNPDRRDASFEASVIAALRDYAARNGLRIIP